MTLSKLWQRNIVGLIVFIVAAGVLVGFQLWPQWSTYRSTTTPAQVAPPLGSITVDGRAWQVILTRQLDAAPRQYGPQLPKGVALWVISIARAGDPPPATLCSVELTDGHRRWASGSLISVPVAPGATTVCGGKEATLQLAFEVPADATPNAVEIKGFDGRLLARMAM